MENATVAGLTLTMSYRGLVMPNLKADLFVFVPAEHENLPNLYAAVEDALVLPLQRELLHLLSEAVPGDLRL